MQLLHCRKFYSFCATKTHMITSKADVLSTVKATQWDKRFSYAAKWNFAAEDT